MKVNIGDYKEYIGPYQLAENICFWAKDVEDVDGIMDKPKWVSDFGKFLSNIGWLDKVLNWINDHRTRNIKVRIDPYDIWDASSTLAYIILPLIKQFRETTHSYPGGDVTEEEWDKILEKIEWSMSQIIDDTWEAQYTIVPAEIDWDTIVESDEKGYRPLLWKNRGEYDTEGIKAHDERIQEGCALLGKYFRHLWD